MWQHQRSAMEVTELWADRLSEITVPPVVVPDSEDLSILPQFGPERALKIQAAEFHLLEGMGHQQFSALSEFFVELTMGLKSIWLRVP